MMEVNPYLAKLQLLTKEFKQLDYCVGKAELSKTEFRLFQEVIVEREKGRKIISSELARRLGLTRSAISQIVTRLEQKDVVKRTASPTDRKIAYIELSERTANTFAEHCKAANAFMEKAVERFGEERIERLFAEGAAFAEVLKEIKAEESGTEKK